MPVTTDQANCTRCNGSGQYQGTRCDGSTYTGPCFACQGGGPGYARRAYRGNAARRDYAAAPVAPVAVAPLTPRAAASVTAFAAAFPAEHAWLVAQAPTSTFAASLLNGIARYGNLTPRQLAAVQRNLPTGAHGPARPDTSAPARMPTDAEIGFIDPIPTVDAGAPGSTISPALHAMARAQWAREAGDALIARQQAEAPPFPAPPVPGALDIRNRPTPPSLVNLDRVRSAMELAAASGLRKVRLTFGEVTMKLSGSSFRNGGRGMILCYHNGIYQGYVDAQNNFRARMGHTCTEASLDAFRTVGADPQAAARTHGMDTGYCSCCRRLLTDPPSVMAGIGPVCIRRFGWSF